MKASKKNQNYALIATAIILIALLAFTHSPLQQTTVSFNNQCSVPSCPSGYNEVSLDCSSSLNKCTRVCEKTTVTGKCGTFSAGKELSTTGFIPAKPAKIYSTPPFYEKSDKCYIFFSSTSYGGTAFGTADSMKVTATNTFNSKTQCSNSFSGMAQTATHQIRGQTGRSRTASGRGAYFGGKDCSGGAPLIEPTNQKIKVTLWGAEAPYIETSKTDTVKKTCTYECDQSSDCGTDGVSGEKFCVSNNVVQKYKTFSCSSNACSNAKANSIVESCQYGCNNGACNSAPSPGPSPSPSPSPSPAPNPSPSPSPSPSPNPSPGTQDSNQGLYLAITGIAVVSIAIILIKKMFYGKRRR